MPPALVTCVTNRVLVQTYQVLVGESCDLVLETGFNAGLRRQLQVLGQQLLLPVVLLLHALQLAAQRLHLGVIGSALSLQLLLQQPGGGGRGGGEGQLEGVISEEVQCDVRESKKKKSALLPEKKG